MGENRRTRGKTTWPSVSRICDGICLPWCSLFKRHTLFAQTFIKYCKIILMSSIKLRIFADCAHLRWLIQLFTVCLYFEVTFSKGRFICSFYWYGPSLFDNYIWAASQKMYILTCAPSEDSDQPALSRSLIRIISGRILDRQGCKVSSCGKHRL